VGLFELVVERVGPPERHEQPEVGRARDALRLHASRVAADHDLVDSDAGGRAHGDKFADRVKDEGRFLILGEGKEEGLCTEDSLDIELYVDAVNAALAPTCARSALTIADLPNIVRPRSVDSAAQCRAWNRRKRASRCAHSPSPVIRAVPARRDPQDEAGGAVEGIRKLLNIPN
jgi:hypothetical protein